jgi:hypothetical protein
MHPSAFEHGIGSGNAGFAEGRGRRDRAVDMAFGRQMQDRVRLFRSDEGLAA